MSGDLRSMGLALRLASRLRRSIGLRLGDSGGDAELPRLRPELPVGLRLQRRGTGLRLCLRKLWMLRK